MELDFLINQLHVDECNAPYWPHVARLIEFPYRFDFHIFSVAWGERDNLTIRDSVLERVAGLLSGNVDTCRALNKKVSPTRTQVAASE